MHIDGACHCGYVTFEGEVDPEKVTICHCSDCQTLSGGPYRASVPVPAEAFKILTGEPTKYVKTAESGNKRVQAFCPRCGTSIYSAAPDNPPQYMVRLGAIRQRDRLAPKRQIWTDSRQPWIDTLAGMPSAPRQ